MLIFKKLKSFYLPYKTDFIWSMLFLVIIAAITVVYPIILQLTIDEVVLGRKYDLVPWISLGFIAVMAVKGLSAFI
ncbi:ABC-type multidrug transport system fused ATPase/permease subunit [Neobacillus niacini]|nr:ABC-type multidrug transport system fused ATPase/permease subunit [Neobacillus niacini]